MSAALKLVLKTEVRLGMLEVFKENSAPTEEVEVETVVGKMRFKTRPAGVDSVTIIYVNGNRLYKILTDCRQSRDRKEFATWVDEKTARPSFDRQADKVLAIPVV